jgi:tetratricopeptide (TPR) repeat protein
VFVLIFVVPLSSPLDKGLLPLLSALRFTWAEFSVRERLSQKLSRAGDMRGALAVRREGVEHAADRGGGFELAMAATSYGMLLLPAGWIAEGIEFVEVAAGMTAGWKSGLLRDAILLNLAGGHAFLGEERESLEEVAARNPTNAAWKARLLSVRAQERLASGAAADAVATYGAALDAAHLGADRDLVVMINNNLAGALIETGDYDQAEVRITAAEAVVSPTQPVNAHLVGTRAELALARGDLDAARRLLDRSEAMKTHTGAEGGIGWTLATRARLEAAAGNAAEARRLLGESATRLEDMEALRAWQRAALAVGEDGDGAHLAQPAPDPLLDRIRTLARPVPERAWLIHRGIVFAPVLGCALPLIWFTGRVQDRVPGGGTTVTVITVLLALLLLGSIVFRRVPVH